MKITFNKDGSFVFVFSKEEAALGSEILSVIGPKDQSSAESLVRSMRTLNYLAKYGELPEQRKGNVIFLLPPKGPPH